MQIPPADVCIPPVRLAGEVSDLFEQLRNPLFRYLLSLGLSVQDGEEVIQEVFLALFQHLKSGKPRDNLRGWIFRVGHNQALKLRRRHGMWAAPPQGVPAEGGPDPEQQALRNQSQRRLAAAMRARPEQDRAGLALRAAGMPYPRLARSLGATLGAPARPLR